MTSEPHFDSFYSLKDECEDLFNTNCLEEGMNVWEQACKSIREHVGRGKLVALQSEFIASLQEHGLDDAANEIREYMRKDALAFLDQNKRAAPNRTSTTDDVDRTKSPQQHYSTELGKLNQTNQAYLFGEPESNAGHFSVSLGHHPGINRIASEPVVESSRENHEIDSQQLQWNQPRSYTAPMFPGGVPAEEDRDRPSGWRHAARKIYPRRHHEEKSQVEKGGSSKT